MSTLDEAMGPVMGLVTRAEALAATGAALRVRLDGAPADGAVAARLDAIAETVCPGLFALSEDEQRIVLGTARSLLLNAIDLLEHPERPPGWANDDRRVLQSIGRLSATVTLAILDVEPQLEGLETRLATAGATFLDVGVGAGWIAIVLAEERPQVHCTGIDVWQPALDLATENVAAEGLADRIELRNQDIGQLDDRDAYDLVWMAVPFLSEALVPRALERAVAATRPGGWVIAGIFASPPDPLSEAITALRTVRNGGHPWTPAELSALVAGAGCHPVVVPERTWEAPVRLVAGRRPPLSRK